MTIDELSLVIEKKILLKEINSYTFNLYNQKEDRIIQKFGEESIETVIAAKNEDKDLLISEVSDLLYHLLVLLEKKSISLEEIYQEMEKRNQKKIGQKRK